MPRYAYMQVYVCRRTPGSFQKKPYGHMIHIRILACSARDLDLGGQVDCRGWRALALGADLAMLALVASWGTIEVVEVDRCRGAACLTAGPNAHAYHAHNYMRNHTYVLIEACEHSSHYRTQVKSTEIIVLHDHAEFDYI